MHNDSDGYFHFYLEKKEDNDQQEEPFACFIRYKHLPLLKLSFQVHFLFS